jgi:predicted DNA-binding transcriptional regulator AlpA
MSKHYSGPVILRAIEAARLLGLDAAAFRQGIRDGWIPRPVPTISSRQQRWLKSELLAIAAARSLAPRTHGDAASQQCLPPTR